MKLRQKIFRISLSQMGRILTNENNISYSSAVSLTRLNGFKNNALLSPNDLPRQPVPTISATILNFLSFNHAFARKQYRSLEEVERIAEAYKVCHELAKSKAVFKLQDLLKRRAETLTNWLTPWWLNVAYLDARTPLPIVTSPGVMLPDFGDKYPSNRAGQIELAISLTFANIKFFQRIIRGELKADRTGAGDVLDMSQYLRLFGTARIPCRKRDEIRYGSDLARWPTHIVVLHNGHSFYFPIMTDQYEPLSREQLFRQFADVFAQSENENDHPVNICSADERNAWADVYERLKKTDSVSLEIVERALFILALDKPIDDSNFSKSSQKLRQCLHGGGSRQNTKNRWFDKTVQFAVNERCECFVTYEHTPAEGPPLASLLDFIVDFISKETSKNLNDLKEAKTATKAENVAKLTFSVNDTILDAIRKAARNIDTAIENLEVLYYKFKHFGKNVPKHAKVSPDSFIQIAMQLAFYRIHLCHAPCYETATLRKFAEGRTETLRLPNDASVAFVEAATANGSELSPDLRPLLFDAIRAHKYYSAIAMNGEGMDRHLLGLKLMAMENGIALPSIFASKVYQHLMHFRLSTSQVPTRSEMAMCFGPSAVDCYGVCYNPQETTIGFTISTYNNCADTSAVRFAAELERALLDLCSIVTNDYFTKELSKL